MSVESQTIQMFFSEAKNTSQIAKLLARTEPWVDRVIAAELDRRYKPARATRKEALRLV